MVSAVSQHCCICLEHVETIVVPLSAPPVPGAAAFVCDNPVCGIVYCVPCLRDLFRAVIKVPAMLPLRCPGGHEIMTDATLALLDKEERAAIQLRRAERQASVPLYCPVPKCSAFIPKAAAGDDATASCPGCGTRVCCTCHGQAHGDKAPCQRANVHRSAVLLAALQEQGCRLCPRCQTGVDHMPDSCLEVECLSCGQVFCFECLGDPDNCSCGDKTPDGSDGETEGHEKYEAGAGMQFVWRLTTTQY